MALGFFKKIGKFFKKVGEVVKKIAKPVTTVVKKVWEKAKPIVQKVAPVIPVIGPLGEKIIERSVENVQKIGDRLGEGDWKGAALTTLTMGNYPK